MGPGTAEKEKNRPPGHRQDLRDLKDLTIHDVQPISDE